MSVRTEADDSLDEARRSVNDAITALNKIVIERCWGHNDWKSEFKEQICESHIMLLRVSAKLEW